MKKIFVIVLGMLLLSPIAFAQYQRDHQHNGGGWNQHQNHWNYQPHYQIPFPLYQLQFGYYPQLQPPVYVVPRQLVQVCYNVSLVITAYDITYQQVCRLEWR